ncbi:MAG: allophanate hydrolase [Pseudomonadota bacterium]
MKDLSARPHAGLSFTLPGLRAAYQAGVTPAEIIAEFQARLEAVNDPGIFIHLPQHEDLIASAEALGSFDPDKPLWGMPFAVKDNIDVAGMPTTAACPAYAYQPAEDAFVVARLRASGAIPVGKTNLDQFATGLVGVRSPYPIPKNSLDPDIVPGGSSGGSGVVVGHRLLPFSLGTDTAGSGRVPAALNDIVGLKPSLGALSPRGMVPACRTLDTISVFAQSVADARAVFKAAQGYDAAAAYSRRLDYAAQSDVPLRLGVPGHASLKFFGDDAQAASFAAAVEQAADRGAEMIEIDLTPFYDVAEMLYEGAWVAERFAAIEDVYRMEPDVLHPVTRAIIGKAEELSAADAFRGIYRLAELRRECEPILEAIDMMLVPTVPTFYTLADLEDDPVTPNSNLGTYTNFVNLLDLCALAVPVQPRDDGRPGNVTLIASAGHDLRLAAGASRLFG